MKLAVITVFCLLLVVHAVDGDAATGYFDVGEQYYRLNRYQEAGVFLNRSVELRQNDSESSSLLFQIYQRKRETTLKALALLNQALGVTSQIRKSWEISNDRVILLREDKNRNGQIEYWQRYSNGISVDGRIDVNGNGSDDAKETWRNGALDEIAHDTIRGQREWIIDV